MPNTLAGCKLGRRFKHNKRTGNGYKNMNNTLIKILAGVAYLAMLIVNFAANALPINNRSTGAISDAYPNLFAPAGFAFSIWGLIYLLLGAYVLLQFKKNTQQKEGLFNKINQFFILTSLTNLTWVFAWHYDYIGLSVLIMLMLLFLLIKIADLLKGAEFNLIEKLFIQTPFNIYFGWITVATIANITVFLVSINWSGFGISDYIWTSIILIIGALIGLMRLRKDRSIPYGLVLIWAYLGILFKHISASVFDGQYPSIVATTIGCLAMFVVFTLKIGYKTKQ